MNKIIIFSGILLSLNAFGQAAISRDSAVQARPNIMFILSDDHSKNAISCYGNTDIQTPGLDRLAAEGMRFNHALTPNSFCTPARAVVLTGKYSHRNGVTHLNQSFDGSQPTFPKLLQAAGYSTALFGKWHLLSEPTGFDHYCVMKMQGMAQNPKVWEPNAPWVAWSAKDQKSAFKGGRRLQGYNNDAITDEALNWLENRDQAKPFCMLLHPKPPHAPYSPAKRYEDFLKDVFIPEPATLLDDYEGRTPAAISATMRSNRIILNPVFKPMRARIEQATPGISEDELTRQMYQEYIKGYYRLVMGVDDNITRVLDYLEQSGLAENTLVIYTSDQGFSLGEHGMYNKQWMYEAALHQPLIVRFPKKINAGAVHDSMVSHVDMAPTLLDYAGLPIPDDMQGFSLKPILEGRAEKVRDASYYHFYTHGNNNLPEMIGVRTKDFKLIHYPAMSEAYQWELFDLNRDPDEMNNLSNNPEYQSVRQRMLVELKRQIETLEDPVKVPGLM